MGSACPLSVDGLCFRSWLCWGAGCLVFAYAVGLCNDITAGTFLGAGKIQTQQLLPEEPHLTVLLVSVRAEWHVCGRVLARMVPPGQQSFHLCLAQSCLFPFSAPVPPFPPLPAVASDMGCLLPRLLLSELVELMALAPGFISISGPAWAFSAKLQVLGWPWWAYVLLEGKLLFPCWQKLCHSAGQGPGCVLPWTVCLSPSKALHACGELSSCWDLSRTDLLMHFDPWTLVHAASYCLRETCWETPFLISKNLKNLYC